MAYSYNLIEEKWIPCVMPDGSVQDLGLREALVEAHNYRELGGDSPLVTASLYRLLLAILHRLFGPEDRDAWRALWAQGRWDAAKIDAYMDKWRHRFDLFDAERPFYQGDHHIGPNPIGSLSHELSRADTLYDHRTASGVTLTPPEAARYVVIAQAFGRWMIKGKYGQLPFGACARGINFIVKGENLFEDLALNLIRYPTRDDVLPHSPQDRPCWEMSDPFEPARAVPFGYLDYLTWLSRRILLLPEALEGQTMILRAKIAPGLRMTDDMRNPVMQHRGRKRIGWKSWVAFQEDKALWRDSAPLFRLPSQSGLAREEQDAFPPAVIEWLAALVADGVLDAHQVRRLAGLGMAGDLNQYRVHFYRREELPLPLALLQNQDLVTHLEAALALAEAARGQLWGALSTLAVELLYRREGGNLGQQQRQERDNLLRSWGAERRYWAALELPFHTLVTSLADDATAARVAWEETVTHAAWSALEAVTENLGDAVPALKAAVLARQQLAGGLAKVWRELVPERDKEATT